jgi:hypothetical protein
LWPNFFRRECATLVPSIRRSSIRIGIEDPDRSFASLSNAVRGGGILVDSINRMVLLLLSPRFGIQSFSNLLTALMMTSYD